jgi:transcriptional regulator with XRE-family HTH domain
MTQMPTAETTLAATLRAWRDRLQPGELGLPPGRARRAVGLRREELAELSGVSVDYIVRLEQGRATAPSPEIAAALARVLQLTRAERDHLYCLAGLQPPGDRRINDQISVGVQRLLNRLGELAIAVFAADWRMVSWSPSWAAILGDPARTEPQERSLVRARFHTPRSRGRVSEWPVRVTNLEASDRAIVADLRRASARYPEDPRLAELLRETLDGNARFAELWRAGAVGDHAEDRKVIEHPLVGDITVDCDVLCAPDADFKLVALTAAPGSEDARRIEQAVRVIE